MAKFKSAIMTQGSGSVGGMVFSHNGSGMYIRGRSIPTNPSTALQQAVRQATSTIANSWVSLLGDTQRAGWNTYAKNVVVKNKLGDSIHLSGINMFVRCNVPRQQTGLSIVQDAPTTYTLGDPAIGSLIQAETTPFGVTFELTESGGSTAQILVYASQPQNQTINFFKGPFRYNAKAAGSVGVVDLVPNPTWVMGQRIFVRTRISYLDGRLSNVADYSIVLTTSPIPPDEALLVKEPPKKTKKTPEA